ncbi:HWE histidine kinase domain-containing protein [Cereibacter sp. SYSU M97828]|nr:HWE histidine kinase domain-containing protein [Cereibacter flavus]
MTDKASILLLEDSALDADLVAEHLRRGGIAHDMHRVWTRDDFTAALDGEYDLILADYTLPAFDGMSALKLARVARPDLPFIFVSATLGEEIAVEALKDGATDYVLKTRLQRLGPCVSRALREANERGALRDAEVQLDRSRARLDAALEIAGLGTFEWCAGGDRLVLDARARDILRAAPRSMAALIALVDGPDRDGLRDALDDATRDRMRLETDFALPLPTGDVRSIMMICDLTTGEGDAAYGVLFDVTDRRAAERQQALVMRELHHRVKNSLASVQSIINFTLRTSDGMEDFAQSIRRRIRSLASSHTLLTDNNWSGIGLRQVVLSELAAYADARRVTLDGPDIYLPADTALPLALAIHEMTTNAAKYGSLSVASGKVTAEWRLEDGHMLHFDWQESGGPPVVPPTRRGFGSILLEQALGQQLDGTVEQVFDPGGVRISIVTHLPH